MHNAGERVQATCPNCERAGELEVYDIGSGPELACPHCEWCWGANGQELKPINVDEVMSYVDEVQLRMDRGPQRSMFVVRIVRSVLSRVFRAPEFFQQARERVQEQQRGVDG